LFGLATGAIYALVAQGLVLVYRGSGVLNLSQGGFVMVGGYTYYVLCVQHGFPLVVGVLGSIVLCAILGAATQLLVLRTMVQASPLTRVIATLGVLIVLQSSAALWFGVDPVRVPSWLPTKSTKIFGAVVGEDRYLILGIGCVLTVVLWRVYKSTSFGRIATAVAESPEIAAGLGHSPGLISAVNWAVGGALAGLAGTLVGPITFLDPTQLSLLVLPGMIAALVGGFRSFPLALLGSLVIGAGQALLQRYTVTPGLSDAIPYLAVILLMIVRGRGIPLRSQVLDRLPSVGSGRIRPIPLLIVFGLLYWAIMSDTVGTWDAAFAATFSQAIIVVSVVVLSGYAGQLSLAQYVVGGVGAFIAAKYSADLGFLPALLIAVAGCAVLGAIMSLASLRTRGITLALVSLGLGVVGFQMILSNEHYNGGPSGLTVGNLSVFGIDIGPILHPQRYAVTVLVILVIVCLFVSNLRRGAFGRRLLAVRSNERAAMAAGVNVYAVKVMASTVAAGIAAIGGTMLAFIQIAVLPARFDVFTSLMIVGVAVVGGLGYIGGAFVGVLTLPGGVVSQWLRNVPDINYYLPLVGGLALILALRTAPDGLWEFNRRSLMKVTGLIPRPKWSVRDRFAARRVAREIESAASTHDQQRVPPRSLVLDDVSVSFGGVKAVDGLSMTVEPGQVHGLIGPNGAGKTTAIDAITGFVRMSGGLITVDGKGVAGWSARRRARAGIARSFQSLELFSDLTVRENIAVAHDDSPRWRRMLDLVWPAPARLNPLAAAAARFCELTPHLDERADSLSFGQRKLVAIARAIATGPSILLLDEPAAGLDDREAAEFSDLVRTLAREWGIAILLVEHNVQVVMDLCDQITVLDGGQRLAEGTPEEIQANPAVLDAYLGSDHAEAPAGVA